MSNRKAARRSAKRSQSWTQNPELVRENILAVARQVFAESGFSGARVDEIAARTESSKRMIYYYFGDKAGLYVAVLEDAYRSIRDGEEDLSIDDLAPAEALSRLVAFTFDHHAKNPDLIRLITVENIHHGRHLAESPEIKALNRPTLARIEAICRRGAESGVFRDDVSALEVHWMISALCFFNVSNAPTFSIIFGDKLSSPAGQRRLKSDVVEAVLRFVARTGDGR
jgi:AcrR family transcriptional regulator